MYKAPADLSTSAPVNLNTASDSTGVATTAVSPTGAPVLPTSAVPWLVAVVTLAGGLAQALPEHTIAAQVAKYVFVLGSALGLASPGWRKAQ